MKTVFGHPSLKFAGPKAWDKLPQKFKFIDSFTKFKNELKEYFMSCTQKSQSAILEFISRQPNYFFNNKNF